jgi:hypothetical protein
MIGVDNREMCAVVLLTALTVIAICYVVLSRRTGSYVNVLTPFLLVNVPVYFVLESLNSVFVFNYSGSRYAYIYIYATYTLGVVARTVAYLAFPSRVLPIFLRTPRIAVRGMPYIFLLLAIALYSPVLVEHPDMLLSPRDIYMVTRVGYGIESFLSTLCVYIGFILLLFRKEKNRLFDTVFVVAGTAVLYFHGSKGQFVGLLLIWLYFVAFVKGRRYGVGRLIALGLGSAALLATLFYFTFSAYFRQNLIIAIASYASEYTANATLVIDDSSLDPQLGRLSLENSIYAFIPREIFPEKRKDFGSLWLASRYYPTRYQDENGAPAFGMGFYYADFGVFAIVYYALSELLAGIVLKILVTRLQHRPDAGTFVLFLNFMDVPLVPTGIGFPLIFYYVIALVVKSFGSEPEVKIHDARLVGA